MAGRARRVLQLRLSRGPGVLIRLRDGKNVTPEQAMSAYEAAARAHDLKAILALVHPDAVYWFSTETSHVGKQAIEEAIRANFDSIVGETYEVDQLRWLARTDDVAVCLYRFTWTGTVDGRPVGGTGRGTNVLCRSGDDWLIVHEHLSRGPAD
jgi:ketosteroid isomerase-like protein